MYLYSCYSIHVHEIAISGLFPLFIYIFGTQFYKKIWDNIFCVIIAGPWVLCSFFWIWEKVACPQLGFCHVSNLRTYQFYFPLIINQHPKLKPLLPWYWHQQARTPWSMDSPADRVLESLTSLIQWCINNTGVDPVLASWKRYNIYVSEPSNCIEQESYPVLLPGQTCVIQRTICSQRTAHARWWQ